MSMKQFCLHNAKIFTGISTIAKGALLIKDGLVDDVITEQRFNTKDSIKEIESFDIDGDIIVPGFIDTHIHGSNGFDTAHGNVEDFLGISESLVRFGVTSFCPTLYPQESSKMLQTITNGYMSMGREKGARILGLHLEGPFISPKKLGAQRLETIKEADVEFMRAMWEASHGSIKIMTLAPEIKNIRDIVLYCVRKGIIVSAGHSDASYENMLEGMQAGVSHSTHVFNAMRQLHHRDPGLLGAILIHSELSCELIADGIHVHPSLIKLLLRDKDEHKIILVTDALGPTGLCIQNDNQKLYANGEEVELKDGVWHCKSDGVMAGSCLTMDKAVQNMVEWGSANESAYRMASASPALLLNKENEIGYLLPARKADFVVLDKNSLAIKATYVSGELKYRS